jgi:hypothetical protein
MKKYFSKRFVLLIVIVVIASGIAFSAIKLANGRRVAPPTASSKDPRTLEEKAKRGHGKIIANLDFNKAAQQSSLTNMVAHSESIVIANTTSNVCRLSDDGRIVRTFYQAKIEQVLKGDLKPGDNVTVSLPGGKVGFADGSTAEVQTVWFKKMVNNKRYLLFLNDKNKTRNFLTTGGPQGVFELPADGRGAVSHSGLRDDAMRTYDNKNVAAFLNEIRQLRK